MPPEAEIRVAVLETQMGRLVSDQESEKGTRSRANDMILSQLKEIVSDQRKIEKIVWTGIGGLAVLQFVIALLFKK